MQTAFLYVHGTGVREPTFSATLAAIGQNLGGKALVEGCNWGNDAGARLQAGGASIPYYAEARGFTDLFATEVEGNDGEALQVALWARLAEDPWWELRVVSLSGPDPDQAGPADSDSGIASFLLGRASTLKTILDPLETYDFAGDRDHLIAACELVAESEIAARCGSLHSTPEGRALLGRAVVATAIRMAEETEAFVLAAVDPTFRDRLVDLAAANSCEEERGLFTPLTGALRNLVVRPLVGLATNVGSRMATNYARRKRGIISDSTFAGIGDILVYQADGRGIRNKIENAIDHIEGTVTLLAHSLGGIACVDLLIEKPIKKVNAVITIGSQAPFFYEIGALPTLPFRSDLPAEKRLPPHFPRWLNIYDPRDFLSYISEPLFGASRVTDIEVNNRLAFPASHSGYWYNRSVWDAIRSFLAQF